MWNFTQRAFSANHQNFADVVPTEEELARDKVLEQIFNMTVVKDPLQPKHRARLKLQSVVLDDMVATMGRFGASIFGMKEREQISFWLEHAL